MPQRAEPSRGCRVGFAKLQSKHVRPAQRLLSIERLWRKAMDTCAINVQLVY
jgi:hypothetical protein